MARRLRREPGEHARRESLAALGRAVSLLAGGRLAPGDASDVAVGIGSVLAEGRGRWEPYPGPEADEKEKELIARVLPLLPREGLSGARREEGLYLRAALRLAVKDPGAPSAAREYLEKYPASPLSAGIGVRLGHEALLAGDIAGGDLHGTARRRIPGTRTLPPSRRYMLAWIRFQSGDADGALRELSHPLSDPSFPCGDPSPFERAVVSLSVRAGRESPLERLDSYPPVKRGDVRREGPPFRPLGSRGETRRGRAGGGSARRRVPALPVGRERGGPRDGDGGVAPAGRTGKGGATTAP